MTIERGETWEETAQRILEYLGEVVEGEEFARQVYKAACGPEVGMYGSRLIDDSILTTVIVESLEIDIVERGMHAPYGLIVLTKAAELKERLAAQIAPSMARTFGERRFKVVVSPKPFPKSVSGEPCSEWYMAVDWQNVQQM